MKYEWYKVSNVEYLSVSEGDFENEKTTIDELKETDHITVEKVEKPPRDWIISELKAMEESKNSEQVKDYYEYLEGLL